MADGNTVSGSGNGLYNWHAYVNIWQNWITDDKISLHVELGYATRYAINVYAKGHLDQGNKSWSGSLYSGTNSNWVTAAVASADVEFSRGTNAWTYSCGGWIQTTGGFAPGTSSATAYYTIPAHPRYKPNAPTDLTVESSTDTTQKLKVTLPSDSGWRLYDKINFYRHTDDGDTEQLYHDKKISNYTDPTTTAGHKYKYDCRVQNGNDSNLLSDMSNVVEIFTSPLPLSRLELTKTAENKAQLKGYDAPLWKNGYEFQVTNDDGKSWSDATVDETWLDSSAPAGTIRYRARAYKLNPVNGAGDTIYSPWTESNSITTICPPNAPTINGLDPVYAVDMYGNATIAFSWTPNHPDGSAQTAAQIKFISSTGAMRPVDITGDTTAYSLEHGIGTLSISVRTKGLDAEWGEWSDYKTTRIAQGASAWFTSPSTNDYTVGVLPYTVEWRASDSTGISYQKIELIDSNGKIMASVEPSTDVRSWNLSSYSMLLNNSSYTLKGYVRNGAGLTTEFTRTFTTDWLSPANPSVVVEYTDDLSAIIHVTNPVTYSDTAMPKSYDIARKDPDGTLTVLGTGNAIGTSVIDRLPPLNTAFQYVVTAHAESETYITFNVDTVCDSDGDEAFNFGDAAETCLRVGFDANASRSKKVSGNTFHFALGKGASPLPTFYSNDDMDVDGTHSYKLHSRDLYERAERITDKPENAVCWFRSAYGRVARVYVSSWNFGYAAENYMLWTMGASLTECVWEEPLR